MSDEESFLSRWSRRKQDNAEDEDVPADTTAETDAAPAPDLEPDPDPEDWLEANALAAPETLEQGDDFAPFLKDGVPAVLRRRALRVLWRTNPALANLDGLVDYGDDFTDAAMVPDVINTAYQVGKGIVRKVLETDETEDGDSEDEDDPAPEAISDAPDDRETEAGVDLSHLKLDTNATAEMPLEPSLLDDVLETPEVEFRPRRMTFRQV